MEELRSLMSVLSLKRNFLITFSEPPHIATPNIAIALCVICTSPLVCSPSIFQFHELEECERKRMIDVVFCVVEIFSLFLNTALFAHHHAWISKVVLSLSLSFTFADFWDPICFNGKWFALRPGVLSYICHSWADWSKAGYLVFSRISVLSPMKWVYVQLYFKIFIQTLWGKIEERKPLIVAWASCFFPVVFL